MKTKFLCYSIFILVILAVTMSFVSATSNETNDNLTLDNAEIKVIIKVPEKKFQFLNL